MVGLDSLRICCANSGNDVLCIVLLTSSPESQRDSRVIQPSNNMRWECIAIYIMANARNGTLYIGVTGNLFRRAHEHKEGLVEGFTKKYKLHQLVFYELHDNMESAIHREKRLKKYTRKAKLALIEKSNPDWQDLYITLF